MDMMGAFDFGLAEKVREKFEKRCIELLEWACCKLKCLKKVDANWGEENITANIYTLIKESQQAIAYDIYVEPEHPLYSRDVLDNRKGAKTAPRIDMVFQHNWSGCRFPFYVEAKNLIEQNFVKAGRKTKTIASVVLKRYVEKGMDHYLHEYYPKGCMLGYVLNGTIADVVNSLNAYLERIGRGEEALYTSSIAKQWMCYHSSHNISKMTINHFLFDFCSDADKSY